MRLTRSRAQRSDGAREAAVSNDVRTARANAGGQRPKELVTVLDFVRYAVSRFVAAKLVFAHGTTDPVAEAAFLVSEALHLPPDSLETFALARVTRAEQTKILDLIDARVRTRKPAAYLVGRIYVRGVPFHVDERVIVPRSYLGELLDGALFGGHEACLIEDANAIERVLDLCTGSGCLAVLASLKFPNATIDAVDLSADALEVAARNVEEHDLGHRIRLLHGDLFEPVKGERYDLILSNPPYVDAAGMANLPPECRHEPVLALAGGHDGLAIIRRIIDAAGHYLTEKGGLLCEVGRGRAALEKAYPDKNFLWLDTEESSGEVFWLEARQLA